MKGRLIVLAGLVLTGPAHVDWQYTRWGMTPAEVIAASNGAVLAVSLDNPHLHGEDFKTLARGTYQSGPFTFTTYFVFQNWSGKLSEVSLSPGYKGVECWKIKERMKQTYGLVQEESSGVVRDAVWYDWERKNRVTFQEIGDNSCTIKYQPLLTKGERGGL